MGSAVPFSVREFEALWFSSTPLDEICRHFGVTHSTPSRWARKLGLPGRRGADVAERLECVRDDGTPDRVRLGHGHWTPGRHGVLHWHDDDR